MAGKVLVPISEHINRLIAIRVQFDIMGVENLIVARTDSEAATLITSNIDSRDHPFIIGVTNPQCVIPLVEVLDKAQSENRSGDELSRIEEDWTREANLKTYPQAIYDVIKDSNKPNKEQLLREWNDRAYGLSHKDAKKLAKSWGIEIFWDCDLPRTREGYYRYQGGTKCAINRAVAFAPYSDLLWMVNLKILSRNFMTIM